jgi:hypothetical protein
LGVNCIARTKQEIRAIRAKKTKRTTAFDPHNKISSVVIG